MGCVIEQEQKYIFCKILKKLIKPITTIGDLKTDSLFADPVWLELPYSMSSLTHSHTVSFVVLTAWQMPDKHL